jgi:hypothetical protein
MGGGNGRLVEGLGIRRAASSTLPPPTTATACRRVPVALAAFSSRRTRSTQRR